MIKEILAILVILNIMGLASACEENYVNVLPGTIYENSNLIVMWHSPFTAPMIRLSVWDKTITNHWVYKEETNNDGIETIFYNPIHPYLIVDHEYYVRISKGNSQPGSIRSEYFGVNAIPPSEPIVMPSPPPRQFMGYSFGNGDCNRIAILMGQTPNAHANYTMETISWDYKYTVPEMISYCERQGANMTPITDGFYTWNP